ncbi:MAG: hypothetical protein U9N14_03090 [Pseudomonadota bacterium]|nr:hypothetical protein [Pseudomonadota bacterium]
MTETNLKNLNLGCSELSNLISRLPENEKSVLIVSMTDYLDKRNQNALYRELGLVVSEDDSDHIEPSATAYAINEVARVARKNNLVGRLTRIIPVTLKSHAMAALIRYQGLTDLADLIDDALSNHVHPADSKPFTPEMQ